MLTCLQARANLLSSNTGLCSHCQIEETWTCKQITISKPMSISYLNVIVQVGASVVYALIKLIFLKCILSNLILFILFKLTSNSDDKSFGLNLCMLIDAN